MPGWVKRKQKQRIKEIILINRRGIFFILWTWVYQLLIKVYYIDNGFQWYLRSSEKAFS